MTTPVPSDWVEAEATVTSCRFQSRALSALAFGVRLGEDYRITFDYLARGTRYSGEFQSPTAVPQNEHISIHYDPLHPEHNTWNNPGTPPGRMPRTLLVALIAILVTLLALLCYTLLR